MTEDNKKVSVKGSGTAVAVTTHVREEDDSVNSKDKKCAAEKQFRKSSSFFGRDRFRIKDKKVLPFYW